MSPEALASHSANPRWKVSLHGGHSGAYCEHATGTLREVLEAAVEAGYHTFGVTEHAPRLGEHLLYDEEKELGWDVAKLESNFDAYARDIVTLSDEFSDRLCVLRGFEIEVVPSHNYAEIMQGYRDKYDFEYIVGSVHFVDDTSIDGPPALFERVLDKLGGLEEVAGCYYEKVAEMVEALEPEVVGHLDLIRKNAPSDESVETPKIREYACRALDAIAARGSILDLNTAGYRKGLGTPYPAPWLVEEANFRGIGFCFGDDSHGPEQVGAGIDDARQYLLGLGVEAVTILAREEGRIVQRTVPLGSD